MISRDDRLQVALALHACRRSARGSSSASPAPRSARVVSRRLPIIWLMLSLSSATSPCASTVIDRVRSPCVTAVDDVGDRAHLRRQRCRPAGSRCRSGPSTCRETPSTCAWPPSLPSVPTSARRASPRRRTCESWSTIVLIVFFSSRISPFASTVIFCERSPLRDRGRDLGDVAHLRRQVAGQRVHVVGQVAARCR